MKYLSILFFFLLISCSTKQEVFTLADLKRGERAEIITIAIQKEYLADSTLTVRMFKRMGIKIGTKGVSRGPEESDRGIKYGFDIDGGSYFSLYEPQASMVRVKRIQ